MTAPPVGLFHIAEAIGRWFLWALMTALNGIIAALGAVLSAIASVFPALPDVPGPPDGGDSALSFIGWLFPWPALLALMGGLITAYIALLAIRVVARWVKVL